MILWGMPVFKMVSAVNAADLTTKPSRDAALAPLPFKSK